MPYFLLVIEMESVLQKILQYCIAISLLKIGDSMTKDKSGLRDEKSSKKVGLFDARL